MRETLVELLLSGWIQLRLVTTNFSVTISQVLLLFKVWWQEQR